MQQAREYAASLDPNLVATYRALVDAIVPGMPPYPGAGPVESAGAVELGVHEYLIWSLDHSLSLHSGLSLTVFPLSSATAALLQAGAVQLIASGQAQFPPQLPSQYPMSYSIPGSPFAQLAPVDRILILAKLERLDVDLGTLPAPYKDDGGFLKFMVDYLCHGTMFGNYSEWSAYGSTRLAPPPFRRLEYFPVSWAQVGYPGVSKGYRANGGFLAFIDRQGGVIKHV